MLVQGEIYMIFHEAIAEQHASGGAEAAVTIEMV